MIEQLTKTASYSVNFIDKYR